MNWNPLSAIKDAVVGAGHAIGSVASSPITQGLVGAALGPLAGAAVGAGGHLLAPGGNLGEAAKGAVSGGAAGAAGSGIRSLLGAPSVSGILGAGKTALGALGGAGSSLASGGGSVGGMNPLSALLAGAQTVNAAQLGQKANDFADKGYKYATDSYDARAPLRQQGIASLMAPKPQTLSGLTAIRQQNPVAQRSNLQSLLPRPGMA